MVRDGSCNLSSTQLSQREGWCGTDSIGARERHRRALFRPKLEQLQPRYLLAADLAITIDNDVQELFPGDIVRYVVAVSNRGDEVARNVRLTTDVDSAIENLAWSRLGLSNESSGNVDESVDLGAGEWIAYSLTGTVGHEALGEVTAAARLEYIDDQIGEMTLSALDRDDAPLRLASSDAVRVIGWYDICLEQTHLVEDELYFVGIDRGAQTESGMERPTIACNTSRSFVDQSGYFRVDRTSPPWTGDLLKTDGTVEGTGIVKKIRTVGEPSPLSAFNYPEFADLNGIVYFPANDGIHGRELWRSNGTEEGTFMLMDIAPGPETPCMTSSGGPHCEEFIWRDRGSEISFLTATSKWVYFTADDGLHGRELWRTDGTAEGTTMIRDIAPGTDSAFGSDQLWLDPNIVEFGDTVFFTANDGVHGRELWQTDGTDAGTSMVRDIHPKGDADPRDLHVVDGQLLFQADDEAGSRYWATDGTEAGTVVSDVEPQPKALEPFLYFQDNVFYLANAAPGHDRPILEWPSPSHVDSAKPRNIEIVGAKGIFVLGSGPWLYVMDVPTGWVDAGGPYVVSPTDRFTESYATEFVSWEPSMVAAYQIPYTTIDGVDLPASPSIVLGNNDAPILLEKGSAFSLGFPSSLADRPGPDLEVRLDREAAVSIMLANGEFVDVGIIDAKHNQIDLKDVSDQPLGSTIRIESTTDLWRTSVYSIKATVASAVELVANAPDNPDLTFSWDLNGDGTFGDREGQLISLTQSDLRAFGINDPGDYVIAVRMNDRLANFEDTAVLTVPPSSLAGDLDGDAAVTFSDFLVLSSNFGRNDATSSEGDLDGDGSISFSDFLLLSTDFGASATVEFAEFQSAD